MSRAIPASDLTGEPLARAFLAALVPLHIERVEREYRFHPKRKWLFDFAWPNARVALEVEGGVWTRGRHTRGAGFLADIEKYNAATLDRWRVFRCTPDTLCTPATLDLIEQAVAGSTGSHRLPLAR